MGDSVTYEEFESAEMKKAQQEQKAFATARRQAVEETIQKLAAAKSSAIAVRQAQTRQKGREVTTALTDEYAKTGLRHAVTQRQWRQRLADLGLSRSGLQQTAQRAADGEKAAADAAVQAEQRQKIAALAQSLEAWQAQQDKTQQESEAKLRAAAEKEIAQHETALYKAAKSRATSQYKAALSAVAKGVKAK